jgi:hypothetical protein
MTNIAIAKLTEESRRAYNKGIVVIKVIIKVVQVIKVITVYEDSLDR